MQLKIRNTVALWYMKPQQYFETQTGHLKCLANKKYCIRFNKMTTLRPVAYDRVGATAHKISVYVLYNFLWGHD